MLLLRYCIYMKSIKLTFSISFTQNMYYKSVVLISHIDILLGCMSWIFSWIQVHPNYVVFKVMKVNYLVFNFVKFLSSKEVNFIIQSSYQYLNALFVLLLNFNSIPFHICITTYYWIWFYRIPGYHFQ